MHVFLYVLYVWAEHLWNSRALSLLLQFLLSSVINWIFMAASLESFSSFLVKPVHVIIPPLNTELFHCHEYWSKRHVFLFSCFNTKTVNEPKSDPLLNYCTAELQWKPSFERKMTLVFHRSSMSPCQVHTWCFTPTAEPKSSVILPLCTSSLTVWCPEVLHSLFPLVV